MMIPAASWLKLPDRLPCWLDRLTWIGELGPDRRITSLPSSVRFDMELPMFDPTARIAVSPAEMSSDTRGGSGKFPNSKLSLMLTTSFDHLRSMENRPKSIEMPAHTLR